MKRTMTIFKITVFADHFIVDFKSGITIDIDAKKKAPLLPLMAVGSLSIAVQTESAHGSSDYSSFSQFYPQLIHFPAFLWENCLVTLVLCLAVKIPRPVCFGVVFDLECISADEHFGRPDKAAQRLLIITKQLLIAVIWRIAGHDQQNRNHVFIATHRIHAVGEILKNKPLI